MSDFSSTVKELTLHIVAPITLRLTVFEGSISKFPTLKKGMTQEGVFIPLFTKKQEIFIKLKHGKLLLNMSEEMFFAPVGKML